MTFPFEFPTEPAHDEFLHAAAELTFQQHQRRHGADPYDRSSRLDRD